MFFKIDLNRLHRDKHEICRCLLKSDANIKIENVCPCDEFTANMDCRCSMFKSLTRDYKFFDRFKIAFKIIFGV